MVRQKGVKDVNSLWTQLACHRLGKASRGELAVERHDDVAPVMPMTPGPRAAIRELTCCEAKRSPRAFDWKSSSWSSPLIASYGAK